VIQWSEEEQIKAPRNHLVKLPKVEK